MGTGTFKTAVGDRAQDWVGGSSGDGGPATTATLTKPEQIGFDKRGGLLIPDMENNKLRRVDPSGIIKTIAGKGVYTLQNTYGSAVATGVDIADPVSVAVDSKGVICLADMSSVRKITCPALM